MTGGLTQFKLKTIIIYSSILGLGWIFLAQRFNGVIFYLFAYSLSLGYLGYLREFYRPTSFEGLRVPLLGIGGGMLIMVIIINLAGIPPFAGFYAKILISLGALGAKGRARLLYMFFCSRGFIYIYFRFFIYKLRLSGPVTTLPRN